MILGTCLVYWWCFLLIRWTTRHTKTQCNCSLFKWWEGINVCLYLIQYKPNSLFDCSTMCFMNWFRPTITHTKLEGIRKHNNPYQLSHWSCQSKHCQTFHDSTKTLVAPSCFSRKGRRKGSSANQSYEIRNSENLFLPPKLNEYSFIFLEAWITECFLSTTSFNLS